MCKLALEVRFATELLHSTEAFFVLIKLSFGIENCFLLGEGVFKLNAKAFLVCTIFISHVH